MSKRFGHHKARDVSREVSAFGHVAIAGLLVILNGCSGSIDTGGDGKRRGSDDSEDGEAPGGGRSSDPDAPGDGPGAEADPFKGGDPLAAGPMPLRRLTNEELDYTLADLLGDESQPGKGFPAEAQGKHGFAQPITVGQLETTRYREAAETIAAGAVSSSFTELAPCPSGQSEEACAGLFIERFGRRAFRRPLDDTERDLLLALYKRDRGAPVNDDHKGAIRVVLQAILQSPQFLYHWPLGAQAPKVARSDGEAIIGLTPFEVAARLSYFLWRSMPDDALLDAAAEGRLETADQIAKQVDRMIEDPKIERAVTSFYGQTLDLRRLVGLAKDTDLFPAFNADLTRAMAAETEAFVKYAALEDGRLETLLAAPVGFVNEPLARLYGINGVTGDDIRQVDLDGKRRSGLLTQASFLTVHANTFEPSPVLRGKVLLERILCRHIPPPPPNVDNMIEPATSGTQTRERFEAHSKNPACASCHETLDPLGFAFENYDAIGGWRDQDAGRPVDASGRIDLDGAELSFDNAHELLSALATSPEVRACATRQWLRFGLARGDDEADLHSLSQAHRHFRSSGWDLRSLLGGLAKSPIFTVRTPSEGEILP